MVVRHHKGPNIGHIRFSMITDVAKTALAAIPSTLETIIKTGGERSLNNTANFSLFNSEQRSNTNIHRARGASSAARTLAFAARVTPIKEKTSVEQHPRTLVEV